MDNFYTAKTLAQSIFNFNNFAQPRMNFGNQYCRKFEEFSSRSFQSEAYGVSERKCHFDKLPEQREFDFQTKYKTDLCRNWEFEMSCPYGEHVNNIEDDI